MLPTTAPAARTLHATVWNLAVVVAALGYFVDIYDLLLCGILWGVLGDKRGRLSVLFGSIFLYSLANILNGSVHTLGMYALWRFVAGKIGRAQSELQSRVDLVCRLLLEK